MATNSHHGLCLNSQCKTNVKPTLSECKYVQRVRCRKFRASPPESERAPLQNRGQNLVPALGGGPGSFIIGARRPIGWVSGKVPLEGGHCQSGACELGRSDAPVLVDSFCGVRRRQRRGAAWDRALQGRAGWIAAIRSMGSVRAVRSPMVERKLEEKNG